MLGAIAGDTIGSVYEFNRIKHKQFDLFTPQSSFTDDSILSVAVADTILNDGSFAKNIKRYAQAYPNPMGGYGARFQQWASSDTLAPYNSWGNGSAMRVSPVGFAYNSLDQVLAVAKQTAEVTHNHPEGIKGAQATAAAILIARQTQDKAKVKAYVEQTFGYDLSRSLNALRPSYQFNESCQETVPEAMIAFLEATDFEDAIRNAVSLGGDTDTMACITGAIAEAFYGKVPDHIAQTTLQRLDTPLRQMTLAFCDRYTHTYRLNQSHSTK